MDVTSVRRVHQEDWTDEGVRFLRARDLVAFARNEPIDDPLFISEEMYQEYSALSGKVSVGDLLVTGVGTIGVPWLVTSENPIYFKDGNIIWFKNAGEIDGEFFFHSFIAGAIQSYINEAAGIGTVGTYTIETGKKTPIWLPAKQEQRCVAAFMTCLDNLITLHQRKYDKLCTVKKSMLDKMFPKPGETEPEIRFEGFTDPWEQRKLGEFSKKKTTKNADGALSETFTNSAEQGVISQLDYFDHDITNDANISGYYVVQPDDFVYNPRISATAPCGPINRNRLNRAGVMSPLYTVFSADSSVDKTYLEHYFKTSRWHAFMFLEGNSGARSDRFSISDATFFEMPIWCPEISEQMAIAKQLETADSLITLHQRKLEKLKLVKKSMLEKMFPKNGSSVPEIRFNGFTDDWEQRKLGDVVQITMGQSPDGSTYSDEPSDYILVQGNADLQNGWVCPRIWTTQITKKADAGDLIMSVRAPAGAMGKTAYNAVIGRGVAAIKGNEFIYQLLVKMDTDGFWKTLSCGSTFESLNSDNIKNAEVKIPTTAEQIKIGGFFQYLDNLITLHQRKVEKLQIMKKSMLEKMFV